MTVVKVLVGQYKGLIGVIEGYVEDTTKVSVYIKGEYHDLLLLYKDEYEVIKI